VTVDVTGPRHRHSPRVRRLAAESGVELDRLAGSGPGGRVTPGDIDRAAGAAAAQAESSPAPAAVLVDPVHPTAAVNSVVEVDLTALVALLERRAARVQSRDGARLTLTGFVGKAVVEALRTHPVLGSTVDPGGLPVIRSGRRGLGIAVDTDRGVVVPVVQDADRLSLVGLAHRIGELTERASAGALGPDDLAGGTFTLTESGSRGTLWDTPVLVRGQVGNLGVGAVVERPVVLRHPDGERGIGIRSMAYLVLAYDPGVVDPAAAARFLATVRARLEAAHFDDELA
jgi:pyruvate dehydrogenase E2 component (dihydrolipoamide acetyltransferase)